MVCDTCQASVLSMSDVEKLYPVTYDQGVSFTVHLPHRDLIFYKRNKLFVADFSDWINASGSSFATIEDRESMLTKTEIEGARKASDFIKSAGFPSKQAAIDMLRDGNINNIPIEVADIKTYFDIYGPPVEAIHDKTTALKSVNQRDNYDAGIKEQRVEQVLVADVMYAGGFKFVVSISTPMMLLLTNTVASLSKAALGEAVQNHIDMSYVYLVTMHGSSRLIH